MTRKQIGDCVFLVMGMIAGAIIFGSQPSVGMPGWLWLGLGVVALALVLIYLDNDP